MNSTRRPPPIGRREPGSIRRWNEYAVVAALREVSPQRVSQLAESTGLTVATLGAVLRDLQVRGWVEANEPTSGAMGRPAQLFSLSVPHGAVLGIDVGAHAVRCVRLDLEGNVLARTETRLPPGSNQQRRHETVTTMIEECSTEATGPIWLTGLAVGGLLDVDGRMIESVAIPEWNGVNPAQSLAGALPSRAVVMNDVRAASAAEHQAGAAIGYDEVLLLQLGRRPTLGILWEGRMRRGAHGTAGDLSRTFSFPTEEHMAWLEPFRHTDDPLGEAVRAAVDGNQAALSGARRYVRDVTSSLVVATAVVDPAILVIGGALSPLAEHFIGEVTAAVTAGVNRPPLVTVSKLDQYATALGAGLIARRVVWNSLAGPSSGAVPFTLEKFEELPLPYVGTAA